MARKLAIDRLLFAPVVALVAMGLLMIYSASAMQIYSPSAGGPSQPLYFVFKQGIAVLLGGLLTIGLMKLDYRRLNDPRLVAMGLSLLAAALVAALLSAPINGTRRWISLGVMTVQPSEFAKIGLVVALAALLSRREGELDDVKRTLLPVAGESENASVRPFGSRSRSLRPQASSAFTTAHPPGLRSPNSFAFSSK